MTGNQLRRLEDAYTEFLEWVSDYSPTLDLEWLTHSLTGIRMMATLVEIEERRSALDARQPRRDRGTT